MNTGCKYVVLCFLLTLLLACGRSSVIPTSGGRSYEVLVTGPDQQAVTMVAEALREVKMEGLPQVESTFDVSSMARNELDQSTRYTRNIVLVSTDSTQLKQTRIRYEQNVYARPQVIVHIDAPSRVHLKASIKEAVERVSDELTRAEIYNGIVNLRSHHNQQATALVKSRFGCRLWVPEDLRKTREGKDFVWFTNDGARNMLNICVYRYVSDSIRQGELISKRDSFMQANVKGETDSIYMTTVMTNLQFRAPGEKNVSRLGVRGLWEMHGDAMGGPFVCLAVQTGDSILCVEGFVYAPGTKKRNLVRRLEASLYTLKDSRNIDMTK